MLDDDPRFTPVGAVRHGDEALEAIRSLRPAVAVLSLTMPGLDGIGVTAKVVAEHLATRCLILTVREERYAPQRAFLAGAMGCVFKEGSFEELAEIILRAAAGETGLRPAAQTPGGPKAPPELGLSRREGEVLQLVGRGLTSKQIAECLFISARTVDSHRLTIMRKLGIQNGPGLVKFSFEHGLDSW
jgi:DNA-binding NarL/FixJ family response regulator